MFSTNGDGPYIELQDHGNDVNVTPMGHLPQREKPEEGVVIIRNEFTVERQ